MKTKILALALLVSPLTAVNSVATDLSEIVALADSAYAADNYGQAIAGYERAIREGGASSELLYNLGNAYYRDGHSGNAVVAYERALKLDPTNSDARFNLQFVKSGLVDRQVDEANAVKLFFDSMRNMLTSNGWAWLGLGLFLTLIGLVALYLFTEPVMLRKIGFFGSFAALVLSVGSFIAAFTSARISSDRSDAVVTTSSVMVSTAPRSPKDRNEEVALLHEGTKVHIVDSLTVKNDSVSVKWYKVNLPTGHQGWTAGKGIEII